MEIKGKYSTLTKYIPQMNDDTIGEWVIDRKNDGSHEHPIHVPFVDYSETVLGFIKDLYVYNENNKDMELLRYREILEENDIMGIKSLNTIEVSSLTPQCVLALIMYVVRGDRFCEGLLYNYLKNGCILKWLKRLETLDCEGLRAFYKPTHVEVLFIGESRPQGGTFFYHENSILYNETKKAFNKHSNNDIFSLDKFKRWGCWLYDICDKPVNGLPKNERKECIYKRIHRLVEFVQQEQPKYIIVCKRGLVENAIIESAFISSYSIDENIFFLPFPACGNQTKYREGLIRALDTMDFMMMRK